MHLYWIFPWTKNYRKWYESLSLDNTAKVQKSAKSVYLDQCVQLVLIKDVCTVQARTANKCILHSYPVRLKISKMNGGDLTNKASCVWIKLKLEWSKGLGKEPCAFLCLNLQCILTDLWRKNFRDIDSYLEFVTLYWHACFFFYYI